MVSNSRRLIRLHEVKHLVGLGRTSIYQKIKDGSFPAPHPIGLRAVAWLESDVQSWVESRIKEVK